MTGQNNFVKLMRFDSGMTRGWSYSWVSQNNEEPSFQFDNQSSTIKSFLKDRAIKIVAYFKDRSIAVIPSSFQSLYINCIEKAETARLYYIILNLHELR